MCSPFNHLNDSENYGPLPATFVQARPTLALWQECQAWPRSSSPWVPAGGPLASLQSHLHCALKRCSELELKASRTIGPRVLFIFCVAGCAVQSCLIFRLLNVHIALVYKLLLPQPAMKIYFLFNSATLGLSDAI